MKAVDLNDLYIPRFIGRITLWSRFLPEKLIVAQPVKKFPSFYGTRKFITVLTSIRHWTLSCA